MSNKVLVIGNGGREHAIVWKLLQSPQVGKVYVNAGSVGMRHERVEFIDLPSATLNEACRDWCLNNAVDMVVVGPEAPLAEGIADELAAAGIHCFGPSKMAARIESDKGWAKGFFDRHGIPTARWAAFQAGAADDAKHFVRSFPALVVKASGLAAGKGVVVASDKDEACDAIDSILVDRKFGAAGNTVVVEELLEGEEVSMLAFCDGVNVLAMLPAQDHKRHLDGDRGGNTGGMGAYCPCPLLTQRQVEQVTKDVLQKTVDGLREEGHPFIGVLYAGLMLTQSGPKVLEFNCRFGDPETQVILPLLASDLYTVMKACCLGRLLEQRLQWKSGISAVGVVMASQGYPDSSSKGDVITGLSSLDSSVLVFHSGVSEVRQQLTTNGGRVLICVALDAALPLAALRARRACDKVKFKGAQYRTDIAHKGIARSILLQGELSYKESGVDISAGDALVGKIKSLVKVTARKGPMGGIGGFGGLFDLQAVGFTDPVLVSGTDGVGTKLKIAEACGRHNTIGIDLVAMCVNDVLANAAEPLFFLDYFACGRLDVELANLVLAGVAEGCRQSGCALIGGETAEMPGLYSGADYDLAGFVVGGVERGKLLPRTGEIAAGDVLLGIASSGCHSNGFSLVRRVAQVAGVEFNDRAEFSTQGKTYGEEFLTPTRIYVKLLLPALTSGLVKAYAHITGGGLTENLPRVLPAHCSVLLDALAWPLPPVFPWLAAAGGVSQGEMLRTFNCGLGAVLVVGAGHVDTVRAMIGEETYRVGTVQQRVGDGVQVEVLNFPRAMEPRMLPHISRAVSRLRERKRVAVLVSGSGTNLQALIDACGKPGNTINADIVLVVSNKPGVEALKRAERAGIQTKVITHEGFSSRLDFDMAVHSTLASSSVDIVCLAGFMRILSAEFVALYRGRLINIHPSLLPAFKGTHAHRQALAAGVTVTGCTAHFVEADVDAGAILVQEAVAILPGDTEEVLQERVKVTEHRVFPKALSLLANDKVQLNGQGRITWL